MTATPPPYEPAPQGPVVGTSYPPVRHRPLGVTILAILEILVGILMLLGSIGFFLLAGVTTSQDFIDQIGLQLPQWLIDIAPFLFGSAGVILLIMALVAFLIAYGFLKGRRWSWYLAMILSVLSVIFSVIGWVLGGLNPAGLVSMLISIIIPVIIIIYLTRPNVKAWFGKA